LQLLKASLAMAGLAIYLFFIILGFEVYQPAKRTIGSVFLLKNWRAGRRFDARDPIEVRDQAG
jgi:hypothetical protein